MSTLTRQWKRSDGMAIYDTLNFMQCDIVTYCIGMAAKHEHSSSCCRYSTGKDMHFK